MKVKTVTLILTLEEAEILSRAIGICLHEAGKDPALKEIADRLRSERTATEQTLSQTRED